MRLLLILALLLAAESPARSISCVKVVGYVAIYGQAAAETWARSQGYTEIEIAAIRRRCFRT